MSNFKSYSSKRAAEKGAERAGLDKSVVYDIDGKYGFDVAEQQTETAGAAQQTPEVAEAPQPVVTSEPPAAATPTSADAGDTGRKVEKNRPTQNGITRPSAGGKCRMVWDECDRIVSEGGVPTPEKLKAWADAAGQNPSNAQIELYQWRKYHSITGRVKVATATVETPAATAGA